MEGRILGRTMYFCLFSEKRAQLIDRRGHSSAHGTDGRYTIQGGQQRGNVSHLCPTRLRGKGVATAAPYNILNRYAAVAWAGSSGSAAEAAIPGAKPHRARQGYAADLGGNRVVITFRLPFAFYPDAPLLKRTLIMKLSPCVSYRMRSCFVRGSSLLLLPQY